MSPHGERLLREKLYSETGTLSRAGITAQIIRHCKASRIRFSQEITLFFQTIERDEPIRVGRLAACYSEARPAAAFLKRSVAATRAPVMGGDEAKCPPCSTMTKGASGHAPCSR